MRLPAVAATAGAVLLAAVITPEWGGDLLPHAATATASTPTSAATRSWVSAASRSTSWLSPRPGWLTAVPWARIWDEQRSLSVS